MKQEASIDDFVVDFELSVRKSNDEVKFRRTFERDSDEFEDETGYGWKNLFNVDKIFESPGDFLVNETLTLVAKVRIT